LRIPTTTIKELREMTGAGILECKNILLEMGGDVGKAADMLKQRGLAVAEKKAQRVTAQGIVEAYIHTGGRIGAMVEINCETDFVARTEDFQQLAHDLAMQVAAMFPQFSSKEDVSEGSDLDFKAVCLLEQAFIKDPTRTVKDLILETIAKVGENIRVARFARFEVGG